MTSLYVDRKGAELDYEADTLVVRIDGERAGTVPLAPLERVVVRGSARLSARLLSMLWQRGIGFVLLAGRKLEPTVTLPGRSAGDAAVRLAQYALLQDESARAAFARALVASKLAGQARVLDEAEAERGRSRALLEAQTALAVARGRLEAGVGLSRASLRGIEGAAAAAYFGAYGELFAPALGFAGRNRRPPRDPVNACLSLGYTLLHADAVRACAMAGLDPMLGIYHDLAPDRESLSCDLAEPLRPWVERWVWRLFRERVLRPEGFTTTKSGCRINKAARQSFYRAYEAEAGAPRRLLRRSANRLARRLRAGPAASPALPGA